MVPLRSWRMMGSYGARPNPNSIGARWAMHGDVNKGRLVFEVWRGPII